MKREQTKAFPRRAQILLVGVWLATLGTIEGMNASPTFAVINATIATDICPITADPCVITQEVNVTSGAVLDFGTRTVDMTGGGKINVGSGSARIYCGQFNADAGTTGFILNDALSGGLLIIEARKRCSFDPSVICLNDLACTTVGAGFCSLGTGDVTFTKGKAVGSSESPGTFIVRAAGDIRALDKIVMNGTFFESDGGSVALEAEGSVFVEGKVETNSGGDGGGGDICLTAGQDVIVNTVIETLGGNFDGGTIEIFAGRDILVTNDLMADANTGEGFGGSIDLDAGNNIEIVGGGSSNRLFLSTEGHMGSDFGEGFGGDGGSQTLIAGGNAFIGEFVKMRANGAPPDGFGEEILIDVDGNLRFEGRAESKAKGGAGAGGGVDFSAGGEAVITSTVIMDVNGGDSGAGDVFITSVGDMIFDGRIDGIASNGGSGGSVDLDATADLAFGGSILLQGEQFGLSIATVDFSGCRIDVKNGASIENESTGGRNLFLTSDRLVVASGGHVEADGFNRVRHREAAGTPIISGTMTPAPTVVLDATLPSCPLCGNSITNIDETCDDGNTIAGDGCSADCQDEGCIAMTPGYPSTPLCSDGNGCTVDVCNTITHSCEQITSCDDSIACTVDTCVGDTCIHTPDNSLCSDDDVCTDELCNAVNGCVFSENTNLCDDELWCNGADACAGGGCTIHSGDPCVGEAECFDYCDDFSDQCLAPFGIPCTADSNVCTDDVCNGLGACVHVFNSEPCDDGVFCNGPDICQNGSCSLNLGDPCAIGGDCMNTCTELEQTCISPEFTACSDDGDVCTDNYCDGAGGCSAVYNTASCDDGDFCTLADQCSAGACVAGDVVPMGATAAVVKYGLGSADDRLAIRTRFPTASLLTRPSDTGVLLQVRHADGSEIFSADIPAANIENSRDRDILFRFRDKDGIVASANHVQSLFLKRSDSKGEVRMKMKMRGHELPLVHGVADIGISLLFGGDPASADCLSAQSLPCTTRGTTKILCRIK